MQVGPQVSRRGPKQEPDMCKFVNVLIPYHTMLHIQDFTPWKAALLVAMFSALTQVQVPNSVVWNFAAGITRQAGLYGVCSEPHYMRRV